MNNSTEYQCWFDRYDRPWLLNEDEDAILRAAKAVGTDSCTNSDLIKISKVSLKSRDVGRIIARLRAKKLIDYAHIETGRMAAGSGRYRIGVWGTYFGEVIQGETLGGYEIPTLPPLP